MKFTKYVKLLVLLTVIALGVNVLVTGTWNDSGVREAYAKEKGSGVKKLKKFKAVVEGAEYYTGDKTYCYTDSVNNKLYINVEDFFNCLEGTVKEAKIKVNVGKRTVKVTTGKEYDSDYEYVYFPENIYGKPENIKFNIDGKKVSLKGYALTVKGYYFYPGSYLKAYKTLFVDFDELAEKLDLIHDKNISKKKFLLYTKLPENMMELKTGKKPIESYKVYNNTSIGIYDNNSRFASPIDNYLYEEDGNLVRVENREKDENNKKSKVIIERYDKDGNKISEKNLGYQGEEFGGFYRGNEYNYLIFGNYNYKNNDNKEVIRIVKYDRNFNELGRLSVNGAYTVEPFFVGSLRCAEIGSTVLVHTARLRYDGHQSSLTIAFNEDTMSLINSDDLGAFQRNHVSHDYNQFVMADGNEFIAVDHGDGHPRSILVSWLRTEQVEPGLGSPAPGGGFYVIDRGMFSPSRKKEILNIPGETGYSMTGVSIGSALNTKNKVLVGVNRVDYLKAKDDKLFYKVVRDARDVVLYSLDKNTLEVTENKYTDRTKGKEITYTAPKMVKLDDTRVMLIWNKLKKYGRSVLQYLIVDENGNRLSEIKTVKGIMIADEAPILFDGKVVWSQYKGGRLVLNSLSLE